jgi:hypothetical protein
VSGNYVLPISHRAIPYTCILYFALHWILQRGSIEREHEDIFIWTRAPQLIRLSTYALCMCVLVINCHNLYARNFYFTLAISPAKEITPIGRRASIAPGNPRKIKSPNIEMRIYIWAFPINYSQMQMSRHFYLQAISLINDRKTFCIRNLRREESHWGTRQCPICFTITSCIL